jgi:hypothetical protein
MGKHSADGDSGFSVHGHDSPGVPEGERNPGREGERQDFNQALADQRARDYESRHRSDER